MARPRIQKVDMQAPQVYPIRRMPTDKYGWSDDPPVARMMWTRLRGEDEAIKRITWYGVGITIHSCDKVTLHVFDMADNVHGGIGDEIYSTDETRFTPREEEMIFAMIDHRKLELAELEYNRRKEQARIAAILEVKKEMFGE